jgi:predicted dehydrogenase
MKKLRVGVIGLGVGEQHVKAYQRHPDCTVTAICDLMDEKIARSRIDYPGVELTKNADDLIFNQDIDLISIASYDDAHADQVISALKSGKHIFCEKPLCQTFEQASQIKQTLFHTGKNLKLGCNLVLREAPLYKWLKVMIQDGYFGQIYAFDGEYLYGRIQKITEGWRNEVTDYSVMEGGGIHLIDLMLWLTKERPVSVFASGNRISTQNTKFRYNDYVTSIMNFENGMIGRITANFGCVHRHHHVMRIYGTKATFLYDDAGPRIHTTRDPEISSTHINFDPLPATKGDLIPGFVSAILTEKDITDETQIIFDGISISAASDRSLKTQKLELINYL